MFDEDVAHRLFELFETLPLYSAHHDHDLRDAFASIGNIPLELFSPLDTHRKSNYGTLDSSRETLRFHFDPTLVDRFQGKVELHLRLLCTVADLLGLGISRHCPTVLYST